MAVQSHELQASSADLSYALQHRREADCSRDSACRMMLHQSCCCLHPTQTGSLCRARSAAPAIIFFDEIDGLAMNRAQEGASGGASLEARVLATLLSEMDGLQARPPCKVA